MEKYIRIILWIIIWIISYPLNVIAVDGQIKITQTSSTDFPIIIDKAGSYILVSNIVLPIGVNVNAIEINSNNVNLDLNGHIIIGPGGYLGFGIYANNKNNISITNGTIQDFHTGIRLSEDSKNGSNYFINHIIVYNSSQGFTIEGGGIITNCLASNGHTGFFVHKCIVTNCISKDNTCWGMGVIDSVINNCNIIHNGWSGIDATNSIIINCIINSNHYNGSSENGSGVEARSSTVSHCTIFGNFGNGIYGYDSSRIIGNNIRNNTKYGLYLYGIKNYVIQNVASNNSIGNFHVNDSTNNYMPTTGENANINW